MSLLLRASALVLLTASAFGALASPAPFRVAVLLFQNENNVFMPVDTTREDFGEPVSGEALLQVGNGIEGDYLQGFLKVAREYGGVELVPISSPRYARTGQQAGWITRDAYEHFTGIMVSELKAKGPFDAVYMSLHGAMSVRDIPYSDAELARRVREVVGPKAVLVGTFDPHGNQGAEFFRWADLAFTAKYYPHYDDRLQGERAARMMIRMLRGDYRPEVAVRKPPILSADVNQWTGASPWSDIVQRALTWEGRHADLFVNFFAGYPWSDVPESGMAFQVTSNGDRALAERVADDLARYAWSQRQALMGVTEIHPLAEGMDRLEQAIREGRLPAIVGDYSDRTLSQVWVLGEIVKRGLSDTLVSAIRDPRAIDALSARGARVGDQVELVLGGYAGEEGGPGVPIKGQLVFFDRNPNTSFGKGRPDDLWAAVRYGNNNVVVFSPSGGAPTAPDHMRFGSVQPEDFKIYVTKHRVHFRSGFVDTGIVKTVLLVDPPGPFLGTANLRGLPYRHIDAKDYYPWGDPDWP